MNERAAADPATAVEQLRVLTHSRSRTVRRAVAANPNAHVDDVDVLTRHFAAEVARNPVLDWWTLTDADWLAEFSAISRERLLAVPTCPSGLLWWAAASGDDEDRLAVASNPACPPGLLSQLAAMDDDDVAQAARLHREFPGAVIEGDDVQAEITNAFDQIGETDSLADLLAGDLLPNWVVGRIGIPSDVDARRELARHLAASPSSLAVLLGDDDEVTRRLALANPNTAVADVRLWIRMHTDDMTLTTEELHALASSSYGSERSARHPNLGADDLAACMADSAWRVREAAATSATLTVGQAALLASDNDRDVRAAAAANPALPLVAARALVLDTDERVRKAAEARVASLGAGATDHREVIAADALRGNGEPDDAADAALVRLLRRSRALTAPMHDQPIEFVHELARDEDSLVRVALLRNPTCPSVACALLVADPDPLIRRCVAAVVRDEALQSELVADANVDVRAALAANSRLPMWLALRLAEDASDEVRIALLVRSVPSFAPVVAKLIGREIDSSLVTTLIDVVSPVSSSPSSLPSSSQSAHAEPNEQMVEELSGLFIEHSWIGLAVARSGRASAGVLGVLRSSADWRIRQSVAAHPNTSAVDLRVLAIDPDNDVRSAVAANRTIAPESIATFFTEADEKVRRALVGRIDLATDLLEAHLVSDDGIRAEVLVHPNLSERTGKELRALIAGTPMEIAVLNRFASTSARRLVAKHPNTTAGLLSTMVSDDSWTMRESVALHGSCGPDDLRKLALDFDRDVRAAVASNPATPQEVLDVLAVDIDPRVRRAAGQNVNTAVTVTNAWRRALTAKLLINASCSTRTLALLSPTVSPTELRRYRHRGSTYWLERFAVAVHPETPEQVRAELRLDANTLVAAAACGETGWPQ